MHVFIAIGYTKFVTLWLRAIRQRVKQSKQHDVSVYVLVLTLCHCHTRQGENKLRSATRVTQLPWRQYIAADARRRFIPFLFKHWLRMWVIHKGNALSCKWKYKLFSWHAVWVSLV